MKPAVSTIVACIGCFALGACSTYCFTQKARDSTDAPVGVTLVNHKSSAKYPAAVMEAVSAEDAQADAKEDAVPPKSDLTDVASPAEPTQPLVEVVNFDQKVVKRTENYVYRAWRVDVANNSETCADVYIEVEWLDAEGFRIDYANESRIVAPGLSVISEIESFDRQENANVSSFRVVTIRGKPADKSCLGFVQFKDKVTRRTEDHVYRSWRVDVVNNAEHSIDAYIEVEWLDKDGFRVDYANESRTLSPGVNSVSDVETFDKQENQRIKAFRVVKLSGR
jgi:hypothetical protein